MRAMRLSRVSVVGMVALLLAALAPLARAQDSFAPVAGQWKGEIIWPSGTSSDAVWTIAPDGRFSVETSVYTAIGTLLPTATGYTYTYEHEGQSFTGTLTSGRSHGHPRLLGQGEDATGGGPMTIRLMRAQ